MNPFDLRGPEFLLFYFVVWSSALLYLKLARRSDGPPTGPARLTDPYAIAYLRGGAEEVLRVAAVGLIDQGQLRVEGDNLVSVDHRIAWSRDRVDKAVLEHFRVQKQCATMYGDRDLKLLCEAEYQQPLIDQGLLASDAIRTKRWTRFAFVALLVWAIGLIKFLIAVSRGRHNVGFLFGSAIIFSIIAVILTDAPRTRAGELAIRDLRTLFEGLQSRASSLRERQDTGELMLLGAVFGIGAVPLSVFPHRAAIFPKASSGGGGSCGSSCGSSCGGGCGGGCGGCGS